MAIVYKITNILNNKSYVGYTRFSIDKRWKQHIHRSSKRNVNAKFDNALRKYDVSNWKTEVLEEGLTVQESKVKEQFYINLFDSYNNGYNSTLGGDGNQGIIMSEESNKRRSNALKGKPKNYVRMHGKTHSNESKLKISSSHKGMKKPWVKWSGEQIFKRALTRRALTFEQYQELHILKTNGFTRKQISQQLNVSLDVVKKWANLSWDL